MPDVRLLSHLKRHPLTHDQALRLRILVTFPERQFSYQLADQRLLALGLATRVSTEIVRATELALQIAFARDGRFRVPELHPFVRACVECRGSGVANEAELFLPRPKKAVRCNACLGQAFVAVRSLVPET